MSSPTQRSLKLMRERGFYAEVVERWIPGANIRRDLLGFADLFCIGAEGELALVQCTSAPNLAARITKIGESPLVDRCRKANFRILAHGWRKVKGRWQVREVDCS